GATPDIAAADQQDASVEGLFHDSYSFPSGRDRATERQDRPCPRVVPTAHPCVARRVRSKWCSKGFSTTMSSKWVRKSLLTLAAAWVARPERMRRACSPCKLSTPFACAQSVPPSNGRISTQYLRLSKDFCGPT